MTKGLLAGALCALASLGFIACGDDDDYGPSPSEEATQQVRACYSQGKEPLFTTDSYGNVAEYLGCR